MSRENGCASCARLQATIDRLAFELAQMQRELEEARLTARRWRRVAQIIHEANTKPEETA